MPTKKPLSFEGVHQFLKALFAEDLHAKRVLSLAGATLGVIESASLAVAMIGQGLALARGRLTKHAIKQVNRLLSNPGIDVDALLVHWVPHVVGGRSSITVAMDCVISQSRLQQSFEGDFRGAGRRHQATCVQRVRHEAGSQDEARLRKREARSTRSTIWAAACVVSGWCVKPDLGEM